MHAGSVAQGRICLEGGCLTAFGGSACHCGGFGEVGAAPLRAVGDLQRDAGTMGGEVPSAVLATARSDLQAGLLRMEET